MEAADERARLEEQTRRNLRGMELERAGDLEWAIALYEQNVAEGFEADWPYGRLVSIYERLGRPEEAIRVLEQGIAAFRASSRRTPQDRRAVIAIFRNRIRELQRKQRAAKREMSRQQRAARRGRQPDSRSSSGG